MYGNNNGNTERHVESKDECRSSRTAIKKQPDEKEVHREFGRHVISEDNTQALRLSSKQVKRSEIFHQGHRNMGGTL
jgi:hypothetical protein